MAHETQNPANKARWVCLYLPYIDSDCTVKQGRKIQKDKAVATPTMQEVITVVREPSFGLPFGIERKAYPRDFLRLGRFRFQLKNEDGTPVKPEIPSRRALLEDIAARIAATRPVKPAATESEAAAASGGKGKTPAGSAGKKKKNTKKK